MDGTAAIYGIKSCDTMTKARAWLGARGVAYGFHDYKQAGIAPAVLKGWADRVGWQVLLNRAGTTFRGLPEADKQAIDEEKAIRLMAAHPSLIKRPVLVSGERLLVGFRPADYAAAFGEADAS